MNAGAILKPQFCKRDGGTAIAQYLFEMPLTSEFHLIKARAVFSGVRDPTFCHWITFLSITQSQGHPCSVLCQSSYIPSAIPWSVLLAIQCQIKAVGLLFDTSPL